MFFHVDVFQFRLAFKFIKLKSTLGGEIFKMLKIYQLFFFFEQNMMKMQKYFWINYYILHIWKFIASSQNYSIHFAHGCGKKMHLQHDAETVVRHCRYGGENKNN